jgi:hypothetical protein
MEYKHASHVEGRTIHLKLKYSKEIAFKHENKSQSVGASLI